MKCWAVATKSTKLPFIQNVLKNNWKYSHYLARREKEASDRYNKEGYTMTDFNGNQWSLIYFVSYHEDREHSVAERQWIRSI